MAAPKVRVLYLEDDLDSREIMCLILANEGFDTICPNTSEDALRVAKEEKFDAYLMDNRTPGMSGVTLCRRIREFDAHTPIIFYSAAAFQHDIDEALGAGAQAYITKPADLDEVVDTIRSTISAFRRLQSE